MPRTVTRSVILDAPAELVWSAVKTPAAFRFVSRGLVRIVGLAARESPWREGETVRGLLLIFDLLPVSIHHLTCLLYTSDAADE